MYYLCSENKGADQLRGYREADLRLCFRICKKPVFSRRGSFELMFVPGTRVLHCEKAKYTNWKDRPMEKNPKNIYFIAFMPTPDFRLFAICLMIIWGFFCTKMWLLNHRCFRNRNSTLMVYDTDTVGIINWDIVFLRRSLYRPSQMTGTCEDLQLICRP